MEFEEEEVEDPNDVNTVISQDPGSGDKADWGSTIKLVIGIAQTPTDPPTTEPTEPGNSSPPPTDEPTDEESTP